MLAQTESNNVVVVYLGNGDGTFQNGVTYSVPDEYNAGTPVLADFNGDGKLDAAVPTQNLTQVGDGVAILLGNGDGTFQAQTAYPTAIGCQALNAADFNRDGKLDVVCVSAAGVEMLLGNGDGTLQAPVSYFTFADTPQGGVTGDFNGDGFLDVVTDNFSGSLFVFLGNGDGTLQSPTQVNVASSDRFGSIVAADFNNDGKLDTAVVGQNSIDYVLLGNGNGTFQSPVSYSATPGPIATGDINGDGILDLVDRNGISKVSILLGNGDGTFQSKVDVVDGFNVGGIITGDVNNDGRLDILVGGGGLSVALQTGPNPFVVLTPTNLTFRTQVVGTVSSAQKLFLTNAGPVTLNVSSVTASSGFIEQNGCTSVAPGVHCSIAVRFAPQHKGSFNGSLTITDDAPNGPQTVPLSGTGTVISLGSELNFGDVPVGTTSAPQTLTVTNLSSLPVSIGGITLSGPQSVEFAITGTTCGSSLPANSSCGVTMTFTPNRTGAQFATVNVMDNGGGSPQKTSVTGTGI